MPRLSNKTKNNNNNMSSSSSMVKCKKHPKHRQSPGVCSLCLAEKLSRVSPTSTSSSRDRYVSRARAYYCSSSSLSSSDDESSYPSSSASPMHQEEEDHHHNNNHRRILSDVNNMMKFKDQDHIIKKKFVGGFWSKFLLGRKNDDNLKNVNNNNINNKVYMSQPLAASSSSMAVY